MKKLLLVLLVSIVFFSCEEIQTGGCTDPIAENYNHLLIMMMGLVYIF